MNINLNRSSTEEEDWKYIELDKVDDRIIKALVNKLKGEISDDFFLSFESLLKIGKNARQVIKKEVSHLKDFKKDIANFILNYIESKEMEFPLIIQLYSPDFLIRAKAIKEIQVSENLKYFNYLLPLIKDPDDSVRWAVIKLLFSYLQDANIINILQSHCEYELNPIIKEKIKRVLNNLN